MPLISRLLSNAAMDVYDIRRLNLDVLLAEAESMKALGEAIRKIKLEEGDPKAATADYANVISQYKGKKRMGRPFALTLERAMSRDRGWMDRLEEIDVLMIGKEAGQIITAMTPEKQAFYMELLRRENESNPNKTKASPFGPIPRGGGPKAETTKGAPKPKRRCKDGGHA